MKGCLWLISLLVLVVSDVKAQVEIDNQRCNSPVLAEIMKSSMSSELSKSADVIEQKAKQKIGGYFGCVCSMNEIATAVRPVDIYCQAYLGDVVCFVYKLG
ncbi:Ground-like domain containing protein [Aphelenchoides besseyi]|nr:Ground-like domain containing protein [Aphelenchoides besseyi]